MPRKNTRSDWQPNPECEAAYGRVLDTARICAAVMFGEQPPADLERDASPRVLAMAMGMVYFLARIDPKDLAALSSGPGSFADWDYKPFPPGFKVRTGVLDAWT